MKEQTRVKYDEVGLYFKFLTNVINQCYESICRRDAKRSIGPKRIVPSIQESVASKALLLIRNIHWGNHQDITVSVLAIKQRKESGLSIIRWGGYRPVLARFIPVLLKGDILGLILGLMLGLSSLSVPFSIANSLNCCFLQRSMDSSCRHTHGGRIRSPENLEVKKIQKKKEKEKLVPSLF